MNWTKIGLIYECHELHAKLLTHAANPLPVHIGENIYRVFYSGRDIQNRSSVGSVDINIISGEVVQQKQAPVFLHGNRDTFYPDGVSIGNTYSANGHNYMLFMGWNVPNHGHWYGEIGRLIINQDLSLALDSSSPLLALDDEDPLSLSYPWVIHRNGLYQMWYGSTVDWHTENGEMLHVIKYAESADGNTWNKQGLAVPFELGVAQAFSRPTVWVDTLDVYHMWYSYRSGNQESYRIGYAQSSNGLDWLRMHDQSNFACSDIGWDSEMVEYPFVFEHKGELFMFYNGNDYGKRGFGLAKVRTDSELTI